MIKEQRQMPKKALAPLPLLPLLNQCARASATDKKTAKNMPALLALHSLRCHSIGPLICPCHSFSPLCPPAHLSVPFRFRHSVRPPICPCHSVFATLSARSFVRAIPFLPLCPPAHLSVPFRFRHSIRCILTSVPILELYKNKMIPKSILIIIDLCL
ncbi:hypothetical protein niasHT_003642 [Heterodera trifolii]|uniref:Uncharacterized protein n=1 Tax=Heterodera trifolii TaxID=157864 RepID=A0ABD2MET8_9BILA